MLHEVKVTTAKISWVEVLNAKEEGGVGASPILDPIIIHGHSHGIKWNHGFFLHAPIQQLLPVLKKVSWDLLQDFQIDNNKMGLNITTPTIMEHQ